MFGSMLVHRLRRRPNIEPAIESMALVYWVDFSGRVPVRVQLHSTCQTRVRKYPHSPQGVPWGE